MSTTTTQKILEGLSRYRTKHQLGSGGMATVYLADDAVLRREVALKIMHEHLLNSPETVKRFTNEAHAVASLAHENVIKIFDYGEMENRPFLVMEYIKGATLISLLQKNNALPNLVAAETARQILAGLVAAHEKGIFHRDIKPDNIMVDAGGVVKIMDFGIAYVVNKESLTLTGSFIGSPHFISPEQAKGEPLTGTTDVFSLGVLLYMCMTDFMPFNADIPAAVVHSIIHDTPQPACAKNRKTLVWLSDFIETCLIKNPLNRPDASSALALIDKTLKQQGLTTSRTLLREYIGDPEQYSAGEEKRLLEHYCGRSRDAVKKRQVAGAIKALDQAKAFGRVQPEDEKAIRHYAIKRRVMDIAAITCLVALLSAGALYFLFRSFLWTGPRGTRSTPESGISQTSDSGVKERLMLPPLAVPVKEETPHTAVTVPEGNKQYQPTDRKSVDTIKRQSPPKDQPAWLLIRTNPPWAKVFIDDIERGITPSKNIFAVPAGLHQVKITKDGFADYQAPYIPRPNETLQVRVQLSGPLGSK
jgi:serine/threonine protein kinase